MAIGSIINLGGGGGSLGGKGMIIVDTATMTVGDVIRVRDVFDSSNVQNKTVATVGTPLFFEVDPYCYYKVCMVQDISDTPTEVGGINTTIDVGQTVYVNVLDKTTLGGIQGILNAHQESTLLNIGDEVTIKVNGADWVMQVGAINLYNSHEVIFVSKHIYTVCKEYTNGTNVNYTTGTPILRPTMQGFYSAIAENDRQYIKETTKNGDTTGGSGLRATFTDYVFPPNDKEATGSSDYTGQPITQIQFPIFATQANRIKTYQGTAEEWWTCDGYSGNAAGFRIVTSAGVRDWIDGRNSNRGALPCFRLTADS